MTPNSDACFNCSLLKAPSSLSNFRRCTDSALGPLLLVLNFQRPWYSASCFAARERFFLLPLLVVLLVSSVLLVLTGGLSYVAPFVYALF